MRPSLHVRGARSRLTPRPAPGLAAGAHSPWRSVVPEPRPLRGGGPSPSSAAPLLTSTARCGSQAPRMTRSYTEPSGLSAAFFMRGWDTTRCVSRTSPGLGSAREVRTAQRGAGPAVPQPPFMCPPFRRLWASDGGPPSRGPALESSRPGGEHTQRWCCDGRCGGSEDPRVPGAESRRLGPWAGAWGAVPAGAVCAEPGAGGRGSRAWTLWLGVAHTVGALEAQVWCGGSRLRGGRDSLG